MSARVPRWIKVHHIHPQTIPPFQRHGRTAVERNHEIVLDLTYNCAECGRFLRLYHQSLGVEVATLNVVQRISSPNDLGMEFSKITS